MEIDSLPYDDAAGEKYAEEHPEHDFKSRIGASRLYLYSESSAATSSSRRQTTQGDEADTQEMTVEVERAENPLGIRDNAILFRGDAIANLPTQRIFKYISHCGTLPLGYVFPNVVRFVVLVWSTVAEARSAYESMREAGTGHPCGIACRKGPW